MHCVKKPIFKNLDAAMLSKASNANMNSLDFRFHKTKQSNPGLIRLNVPTAVCLKTKKMQFGIRVPIKTKN